MANALEYKNGDYVQILGPEERGSVGEIVKAKIVKGTVSYLVDVGSRGIWLTSNNIKIYGESKQLKEDIEDGVEFDSREQIDSDGFNRDTGEYEYGPHSKKHKEPTKQPVKETIDDPIKTISEFIISFLTNEKIKDESWLDSVLTTIEQFEFSDCFFDLLDELIESEVDENEVYNTVKSCYTDGSEVNDALLVDGVKNVLDDDIPEDDDDEVLATTTEEEPAEVEEPEEVEEEPVETESKHYKREELIERFTKQQIVDKIQQGLGVTLNKEDINAEDSQYGFSTNDVGIDKYTYGETTVFIGEDRAASWYFVFFDKDEKKYMISGGSSADLTNDIKEIQKIVGSLKGTEEEVPGEEEPKGEEPKGEETPPSPDQGENQPTKTQEAPVGQEAPRESKKIKGTLIVETKELSMIDRIMRSNKPTLKQIVEGVKIVDEPKKSDDEPKKPESKKSDDDDLKDLEVETTSPGSIASAPNADLGMQKPSYLGLAIEVESNKGLMLDSTGSFVQTTKLKNIVFESIMRNSYKIK